MNCRHHEDTLLDIARGMPVDRAAAAALEEHIADCPRCGARLAREQALTTGLRMLVRSTGGEEPPAALEAPLVEAFRGMHPPAPAGGNRAGRSMAWMAAAAAVLVAAAGIAFLLAADRRGDEGGKTPADVAAVSEFVPWPGAASLPAFESGELLRTELPASALPLLGLVPARKLTGSTVTADVLVGQDGLARAVRLVNF